MRCASPPESVFARLSSVRYSIPTLSINWRRASISLSTVCAISFSFGVRGRFLRKSCASCIVIEVTSTIVFPLFVSPPKNTWSASGRSRLPLHVSHTSSWKKPMVPRPLQLGHAPYGELNEKRRGSTSGNDVPSFGQINFDERVFSVLSGDSISMRPSDSWSACSIASAKRSRASFLEPVNSERNSSSTSTLISCLFCLPRIIFSRREYSCPSIRTFSYPLPKRS